LWWGGVGCGVDRKSKLCASSPHCIQELKVRVAESNDAELQTAITTVYRMSWSSGTSNLQKVKFLFCIAINALVITYKFRFIYCLVAHSSI